MYRNDKMNLLPSDRRSCYMRLAFCGVFSTVSLSLCVFTRTSIVLQPRRRGRQSFFRAAFNYTGDGRYGFKIFMFLSALFFFEVDFTWLSIRKPRPMGCLETWLIYVYFHSHYRSLYNLISKQKNTQKNLYDSVFFRVWKKYLVVLFHAVQMDGFFCVSSDHLRS